MDDKTASTFIGEGDLGSMLDGMAPEQRRAFFDQIGFLQTVARARQGEAAFDAPRAAAAHHEAGHAVVAAHEGRRVLRAKIFRRTVPGRRVWLGVTDDDQNSWSCGPLTPPESDLVIARNKIAGIVAERLFERDPRDGSALDEVLLFLWLCAAAAAAKLGRPPHEVALEQAALAAGVLRLHEPTVRQIARALVRHGTLRGQRLARLLAPVYESAPR